MTISIQKQIPKKWKLFYQNMKHYYQWKNLWLRYAFIFLIVMLASIQLLGRVPEVEYLDKIDYSSMGFAGEQIPFQWNYFFNQEKFDRELAITKLNTAQFVMIHKREPRYLPYIQKELKDAWLPTDIQYLVVAESALRNTAVSSAGAGGLRQFMPETARRYWLQVDNYIDERMDVVKSTKAAIQYLQNLYNDFDDRSLAAAAYNRWENWLYRDMQRQGTSGYYDLWLNSETSRYVFRIIAIKFLMENRYSFFDKNILWSQYKLPKTKIIKVNKIDDIAKRALDKWSSYNQIKLLNPRILKNELPDADQKWEIKVFR